MENKFYSQVFTWLFAGLLLTFGTGYIVSISEPLLLFVARSYIIFAIAQIVLCIVLSVRLKKMSVNAARALYLGYTILTGATFASIFIVYELTSIMYVFLATAIVFGIFAFIGHTTKINLNKFGIYLLVGLLAIIVLEIINIFLLSDTLDMGLCIFGVVIFIGYIAYDMQKIKYFAETNDESYAVLGAFELYLDFINLFLRLLNLFGKSDD